MALLINFLLTPTGFTCSHLPREILLRSSGSATISQGRQPTIYKISTHRVTPSHPVSNYPLCQLDLFQINFFQITLSKF